MFGLEAEALAFVLAALVLLEGLEGLAAGLVPLWPLGAVADSDVALFTLAALVEEDDEGAGGGRPESVR